MTEAAAQRARHTPSPPPETREILLLVLPLAHFPKIKQMFARKSLRPKIAKIFSIQNEFVFEKENLICGSQD
jgi:hypothetical protein